MNARRKWALENAACALVVFGTIAAVLLVNAESTTGSTDYTRSAPASYSDEDRTIMDALTLADLPSLTHHQHHRVCHGPLTGLMKKIANADQPTTNARNGSTHRGF